MEGVWRVLAMSRDRGGVQAIIPVVERICSSPDYVVKAYFSSDCVQLADKWNVESDSLEKSDFVVDPDGWMSRVFDLFDPQLLLTGTSRPNNVETRTPEQYAIREAHRRCIPCIAVLDYWGMYQDRFCLRDGVLDETILPDTICALDSFCRDDLVRLGIPLDRIEVTHNPWIDSIVTQLGNVMASSSHDDYDWDVVFISQPLYGISETSPSVLKKELLNTLVYALSKSGKHRNRVRVWKHPAEDVREWKDVDGFSVENVDVSLCQECRDKVLASVDAVASVHSTLVYEALYYGTSSISLRIGLEKLPKLHIEQLGLSESIATRGQLENFFKMNKPNEMRKKSIRLKEILLQEGAFFSDGNAATKVLQVIDKTLGAVMSHQ